MLPPDSDIQPLQILKTTRKYGWFLMFKKAYFIAFTIA